jgi:hypothetical protein
LSADGGGLPEYGFPNPEQGEVHHGIDRAALVDEGFVQASVSTRMQNSPDEKRQPRIECDAGRGQNQVVTLGDFPF